MGILLNLAAFVLAVGLFHIAISVVWVNAQEQFFTRRLLDKAILRGVDRSALNLKLALMPMVGLGPLAITLLIVWFIPGGLDWLAGSWGLKGAAAVALLELVLFIRTSADSSRAEVYKENLGRIREPLAAWQVRELEPFRKAWALELVNSVEDNDDDDDDDDDDDEGAGNNADHPPARLDFEIEEAHEGSQLLEAAPYWAPGGSWTVLKCRTRTEPAAPFWFGETSPAPSGDTPFAFGDAKVWTETDDDWRALCGAVVSAFRPGDAPFRIGTPEGPVAFGTAVLSRSTALAKDGGFAGSGSWTATKWFAEDGSEFFLNWSIKDRAGHFSEKDEDYADGVCEAFGATFEGRGN